MDFLLLCYEASGSNPKSLIDLLGFDIALSFFEYQVKKDFQEIRKKISVTKYNIVLMKYQN